MWNKPSTEELSKIQNLYSNQKDRIKTSDVLIYLHFSILAIDWYIAEYDGEDTFFGATLINNDIESVKWGYFSFSELCSIYLFFVPVERDLDWEIKKFGELDIKKI